MLPQGTCRSSELAERWVERHWRAPFSLLRDPNIFELAGAAFASSLQVASRSLTFHTFSAELAFDLHTPSLKFQFRLEPNFNFITGKIDLTKLLVLLYL